MEHGTINLVTQQVMTAVLKSNLRRKHVRWPGTEEKKAAKQWVADQSTPLFWNGWCMVDGTTISIFEKPHYYGESFYDQKSQYLINTQIINMFNRQIIDYAIGFNGNRHEMHCFFFTRLAQNHTKLLLDGE